MRRAWLLPAIACLLVLSACNGPTEKKESGVASDQFRKALDQEQAQAERKKQEFVKRAQAELDQLDKQMADLQAQATKANAKTRKQIDKSIAELEPRRKTAEQRLNQLKSSSGKAWTDLKDGVTAAIDDLSAACSSAVSRFK